MIRNIGSFLFQHRVWYGSVPYERFLSPKIKHGLFTGIPIILNLYCNPLRYSQHCFIATNSLPKELVYIDDCFLENQYRGVFLIVTKNPLLDLLVLMLPPAKSASTKALMINNLPILRGVLDGINSFRSS